MFTYPFNNSEILKKKRALKKELKNDGHTRIQKKIAVLGGSTTNSIVDILELFLLDYGIEPVFYQSDYGMYWQDAMFGNPEFDSFEPDVIFIHTSLRNIVSFPDIAMTEDEIRDIFNKQCEHFRSMWEKLSERNCPIIQNNFEMPYYRLMGNMDSSDIHGRTNYVLRLNEFFSEYARKHTNFYIHDLNYVSANYGLRAWSDPFYWNMYKSCMCIDAIPEFAFNLSHIIKSIFGKNKKALALDLDNTLWGGVIGDDGVNGIKIGSEEAVGQSFAEFQEYISSCRKMGVILTVCSKNEYNNAAAGLSHPDNILKPDDFTVIKANWENKDKNILEIADELNILPESIVFIDDNPAERELVKSSLGIEAPELSGVESYIRTIDANGYFETTALSADDINRTEMYKANVVRKAAALNYSNHEEYLDSLDMKAIIEPFDPLYLQRITQLTNKTNQFNLTTRRYTESEICAINNDNSYLTLYGRLSDKFGDNGIVSVIIGRIEGGVLDIDLWLMSCRVLKRDMEYAMADRLFEESKKKSISKIIGHYYPSEKNVMVKYLYDELGFDMVCEDETGNKRYSLSVEKYKPRNKHIDVSIK